MPRTKPYFYLVDGLTDDRARIIHKGLSIIGDIAEVQVDVTRSMVRIQGYRDVQDQVKLACDVAGAHFRSRATRRNM